MKRLIILPAISLFAFGCVQTGGEINFRAELNALRKDVEELKARTEVNTAKINTLDERVARVEDKTASNEQRIYETKKMCEEVNKTVSTITAPSPLPQPAQEESKEEKPPEVVSVTDKDIYKKAFDAMESGDLETAKQLFETLVNKFPKSSLADNSLYWIGEIYYSHNDYQTALTYFKRVVDEYPSENKVPAAMLKMGLCYKGMGDLENARQVLKKLIQMYPSSNAASIAKVKLVELGE
jgi:tol-pal system protein YbgF